jgi:biopolymer transport protein ExbB
MWPLLACSIIATAIVLERFWTLQRRRVTPGNLVAQVWQWAKAGVIDARRLQALRQGSPLGQILAAGIANAHRGREEMKESIEEVGRHVVHELSRHLDTLGTIASVSPLLGLLGTVFGMIQVFTVINAGGMGRAEQLAGGIGQALITTAAGLCIAIPALLFYRYFRNRVTSLVITMEQEALRLVEILHGAREREQIPPSVIAPEAMRESA